MKKIIKYTIRTVLFILMLILSYFILAVVLALISTNPTNHHCDETETIFIQTNGIHLDFILDINDIDTGLIKKLDGIGHPKFIAFGWGDKGFFINTPTWDDLSTKTVVRAMFLKSSSVMHITKHYKKRNSFIEIKICKEQREKLIAYIEKSFATNSDNNFLKIEGAGYTTRDYFYEGKGSYNCIKTCNEWINRGLKKADIKTAIWSPFDEGILYRIKK